MKQATNVDYPRVVDARFIKESQIYWIANKQSDRVTICEARNGELHNSLNLLDFDEIKDKNMVFGPLSSEIFTPEVKSPGDLLNGQFYWILVDDELIPGVVESYGLVNCVGKNFVFYQSSFDGLKVYGPIPKPLRPS